MTEFATRNRFVTGARPVADGPTEGLQAMAIPLDPGPAEPLVAAAPPPSQLPEPPASEIVEPGRALALTDFNPPETTAAERLVRLAYRLGVSGHSLVAPFR